MKYFDNALTEDEINEIEKCDCIFSFGVISLDDKKNLKLLNSYSYNDYLKKENTEDSKGGGANE